MKDILAKVMQVKDVVVSVAQSALGVARGVCGAARDLSKELPEGTLRNVAAKVAGGCEVLGLMPKQQQPAPAPAEPERQVHALEDAVVRAAAGEAAK